MDDLKSYSTVQKWLANQGPASPSGRQTSAQQLQVLQDFLEHLQLDPDVLIAASSDLVEGGTATRNRYLKELKTWLGGLELPEHEKTRRENFVRGFFIKNSIKVMTKPYADVYRRSAT